VEEKDARESGETGSGSFGKKVSSGKADTEDPVGKVVGGWNVVGAGQNCPSAEEVDEDGDADREAAEEPGADWYPDYENGKRGYVHRVGGTALQSRISMRLEAAKETLRKR
jgi:hypothetical protein